MKNYRVVLIIGLTEILIGSITLFFNLIALALSINQKPVNVLIFVIMTGIASTLIGFGILNFKKMAYQLLLYFSSVILLSKILIFLGIIHLSGALEVSLHQALDIPLTVALKNFMIDLKNAISIFYHSFIIYYLCRQNIKQIFHP